MARPLTDEDFDPIRLLLTQGLNKVEIAQALGLTQGQVGHRIITLRKRKLIAAAIKQGQFKCQKTERPCLRCQKAFRSEGIHNRLCMPCKARSDSPFAP